MAYEDIYKGLNTEERERMLRQDIPKFETVGEFEQTEEDRKKARETLMKFIRL